MRRLPLTNPLPCRMFDVSYVHNAETTIYARLMRECILNNGVGEKRAVWKGRFEVSGVAQLLPRPLLPPGHHSERRFAHLKRRGPEAEWRTRSIVGKIVPYCAEDFFVFLNRGAETRYPVVEKKFRHVEVPLGCLVPIGPFPLLVGSQLAADSISWFLVVKSTNFAVGTVATTLWEVFGTRRLWAYSQHLMMWISHLPSARVVAPTGVDKLQELIVL